MIWLLLYILVGLLVFVPLLRRITRHSVETWPTLANEEPRPDTIMLAVIAALFWPVIGPVYWLLSTPPSSPVAAWLRALARPKDPS